MNIIKKIKIYINDSKPNYFDYYTLIKSVLIHFLVKIIYGDQVKLNGFSLLKFFPEIRGKNGFVVIAKGANICGKLVIKFDDPNNLGNLNIGRNFKSDGDIFLSPRGGTISIGDNCFLGEGVHIQSYRGASIIIESNVLIARNVSIFNSNHAFTSEGDSLLEKGECAENLFIGKNVWIGANATLLAGVSLGRDSVVGAGAVVTRPVPEKGVIVGFSAKELK